MSFGTDGTTSDEIPTREGRKAQSRRKILESARDVFFRDGFMAANLDEVADGAGVAKGTLYRYFASKADLYVAVLADNGKVFHERMSDVAQQSGGAADRLRNVSRFYLEHWLRHNDYFQIFWAIDNQSVIGALPSSVVEEVSRLWEQSLATVDAILSEGVQAGEFAECDTWAVANLLWTLANGLIQTEATEARRSLRRRPLAEVYVESIEVVLRGLAPGSPSS